jgi:ribosomal protein S18 acetylase RimI-like enzyme
MQDPFTIVEGGTELLDRVEPLWLELRRHHAAIAPIWKDELLSGSFEARRIELLSRASGGLLVLVATANDHDVGYCISSIDNAAGQVESLFVQEGQRSHGIGRRMMSRTMEWFESQPIASIGVSVIAGNEEALNFYSNYGFRPRSIRMLHIKHESD